MLNPALLLVHVCMEQFNLWWRREEKTWRVSKAQAPQPIQPTASNQACGEDWIWQNP